MVVGLVSIIRVLTLSIKLSNNIRTHHIPTKLTLYKYIAKIIKYHKNKTSLNLTKNGDCYHQSIISIIPKLLDRYMRYLKIQHFLLL
jgi:hypothetical protein